MEPGPGLASRPDPDPVTAVLAQPHPLLVPIRA